ncbi:hypothetical protein [Gorillibacterium sp. sgz5001074]|uniref:hypothetical protein n=1 Tax=Gorillibacterium sp. sgz5001074 TaxID=3446695 RepID=UPI003F67210B
MKRIIYVAGVNRKHLAQQADHVPFWLLSATLLRRYPSWLAQYVQNRKIIWDPGTFSEDPVSYSYYRSFIDRYVKSKDQYLQYDEVGDSESTAFYLQDMRKRGYNPMPVLQGDAYYLLRQEPMVAIGGLVRMGDDERKKYLDEIFYDHRPSARIHLLGMKDPDWFAPYMEAVQGDNTTWIPRSEWNRKKLVSEWLKDYGEQWIPYQPREFVQMVMGF